MPDPSHALAFSRAPRTFCHHGIKKKRVSPRRRQRRRQLRCGDHMKQDHTRFFFGDDSVGTRVSHEQFPFVVTVVRNGKLTHGKFPCPESIGIIPNLQGTHRNSHSQYSANHPTWERNSWEIPFRARIIPNGKGTYGEFPVR